MANDNLKFGTSTGFTEVSYNGTDIKLVKYNNAYYWAKPMGSFAAHNIGGVQAVSFSRTGLIDSEVASDWSQHNVYYGDSIEVAATAAGQYNSTTINTISVTYTLQYKANGGNMTPSANSCIITNNKSEYLVTHTFAPPVISYTYNGQNYSATNSFTLSNINANFNGCNVHSAESLTPSLRTITYANPPTFTLSKEIVKLAPTSENIASFKVNVLACTVYANGVTANWSCTSTKTKYIGANFAGWKIGSTIYSAEACYIMPAPISPATSQTITAVAQWNDYYVQNNVSLPAATHEDTTEKENKTINFYHNGNCVCSITQIRTLTYTWPLKGFDDGSGILVGDPYTPTKDTNLTACFTKKYKGSVYTDYTLPEVPTKDPTTINLTDVAFCFREWDNSNYIISYRQRITYYNNYWQDNFHNANHSGGEKIVNNGNISAYNAVHIDNQDYTFINPLAPALSLTKTENVPLTFNFGGCVQTTTTVRTNTYSQRRYRRANPESYVIAGTRLSDSQISSTNQDWVGVGYEEVYRTASSVSNVSITIPTVYDYDDNTYNSGTIEFTEGASNIPTVHWRPEKRPAVTYSSGSIIYRAGDTLSSNTSRTAAVNTWGSWQSNGDWTEVGTSLPEHNGTNLSTTRSAVINVAYSATNGATVSRTSDSCTGTVARSRTFKGWLTSGVTNPINPGTWVSGATTKVYYPSFSAWVDTNSYTHNFTFPSVQLPSVHTWRQAGWIVDGNLSTSSSATFAEGNHVVTASVNRIAYNIAYILNTGISSVEIWGDGYDGPGTITSSTTCYAPMLETMYYKGTAAAGYHDATSGSFDANQDKTISVSATANTYSYRYLNQGSLYNTQALLSFPTMPTTPANPTYGPTAASVYTFTGWSITPTTGTIAEYSNGSTINITAQYCVTTRQYTITWKNQAGTTTLGTGTYNYGSSVVGPNPEGKTSTAQYNYIFQGWATSPNQESGSNPVTINGITTYYEAYYPEIRKYNVTWYRNGGPGTAYQVLQTRALEYGTKQAYTQLTQPLNPPNYYQLDYWGDEQGHSIFDMPLSSDRKYYTVWKPTPWTGRVYYQYQADSHTRRYKFKNETSHPIKLLNSRNAVVCASLAPNVTSDYILTTGPYDTTTVRIQSTINAAAGTVSESLKYGPGSGYINISKPALSKMINVTCTPQGSTSLSVNIKAIDSTIANKSADYSWSGSITDSSMTYDVADWADSTDAIYFTTSGTLSTSFKTIFQYDMYEIENYNITLTVKVAGYENAVYTFKG